MKINGRILYSSLLALVMLAFVVSSYANNQISTTGSFALKANALSVMLSIGAIFSIFLLAKHESHRGPSDFEKLLELRTDLAYVENKDSKREMHDISTVKKYVKDLIVNNPNYVHSLPYQVKNVLYSLYNSLNDKDLDVKAVEKYIGMLADKYDEMKKTLKKAKVVEDDTLL